MKKGVAIVLYFLLVVVIFDHFIDAAIKYEDQKLFQMNRQILGELYTLEQINRSLSKEIQAKFYLLRGKEAHERLENLIWICAITQTEINDDLKFAVDASRQKSFSERSDAYVLLMKDVKKIAVGLRSSRDEIKKISDLPSKMRPRLKIRRQGKLSLFI